MPRPIVCMLLGACVKFTEGIPCSTSSECPTDFACDASLVCLPKDEAVAGCPGDVTADLGFVVMDAFEASRADASDTDAGSEESAACSVGGVLPWTPSDPTIIDEACSSVGKRACTSAELEQACRGGDDREYPYGNDWESGLCNDVDGGAGGIATTGSFVECVDQTGTVFDLVGNVADADGSSNAYGGGWQASHTFAAHCGGQNSFENGAGDPAGFRCCQ